MNSFRILLSSLIVISLVLTNVKCYSPDPRVGQARILVGSNIYFFGGNTMNPRFTNQVLYLNLSSSFNITSPPWSQIAISPIPIPLHFPASCLSTDGSTVYLVGGMSQDQQNSSILMIPQSSVYAFNTNSLQWTTPSIINFNNTFLGREDINSAADSNGKCYFFGGYSSKLTAETTRIIYNDTNIFDTMAMKWSTLTLPNAPFACAFCSSVLKDNLIIYIGGIGSSMNKTTAGDQIDPRSGQSAVLTQDGRIIIYGGKGTITDIRAQPDVAVLDVNTTPYTWKAITDKAPQSLVYHSATLYGIYMIIAFGSITPSNQLSASASIILNNNLYIFNTQNYTWVNTFDATFTGIYGPNSTKSGPISLGAKIGIGIGVVAAVGIIAVVGFFLYKKFHNREGFRNSIATPGTQYI
ncbi:hypothetical protein C2G38_2150778 [Gigaspora rosea]|uniref:Galactose oxidase n=1 Tax=Gigaspora rosea TaxID=44941 RepID=A0A397TRP1_9GLOM|nr:hypothetical protein C2G38_2150778 [Gigaspora rosea]